MILEQIMTEEGGTELVHSTSFLIGKPGEEADFGRCANITINSESDGTFYYNFSNFGFIRRPFCVCKPVTQVGNRKVTLADILLLPTVHTSHWSETEVWGYVLKPFATVLNPFHTTPIQIEISVVGATTRPPSPL